MSPVLSRASLFAPAPLLDPAVLAGAGRRARGAARTGCRVGGRVLGGVVAAAVAWVIVAGPGFVSERSSTVAARHSVRVAAR